MSDYGRLQDERDALLVENERLRSRVAELECQAVAPSADDRIAVETERAEDPEASRGITQPDEPEGFAAMSATADQIAEDKASDPAPEPVDWDAVHQAETDKVITEGQPNG